MKFLRSATRSANKRNILFTDEAYFLRDSIKNVHNTHYWTHENPYVLKVTASHPSSICCGIVGDELIGPHYVLFGYLTGQIYTSFLEDNLLVGTVEIYSRYNTKSNNHAR
ncbi:hypothetical protein NQ314_002919 [Rhamnusium bicolor]|uniref:Uncharacterized protein n=1 Tax=Rhamnusium bicolor TaxID=1586634 RepID=A0AAV8ZNS7_9CUCU|nr:hypothetical protein NQ314_002919 [Rhamnusium bicolor]